MLDAGAPQFLDRHARLGLDRAGLPVGGADAVHVAQNEHVAARAERSIPVAASRAAQATVFWPVKAELPSSIRESYPQRIPPLRSDRDSILVGLLESRQPS